MFCLFRKSRTALDIFFMSRPSWTPSAAAASLAVNDGLTQQQRSHRVLHENPPVGDANATHIATTTSVRSSSLDSVELSNDIDEGRSTQTDAETEPETWSLAERDHVYLKRKQAATPPSDWMQLVLACYSHAVKRDPSLVQQILQTNRANLVNMLYTSSISTQMW
jgi:hypothetical protein